MTVFNLFSQQVLLVLRSSLAICLPTLKLDRQFNSVIKALCPNSLQGSHSHKYFHPLNTCLLDSPKWGSAYRFLLINVLLSVSDSVRPHAGDSLRLLEDGMAGEHSSYRHGDQLGGSGQGGY